MITIDTTITQSIQQAVAIIRQGRALERMLIEAGFTLTDVDGEHHPKPSNGADSNPNKADSSTTHEPDQKAQAWPQANDDGELIDARGIVWDERIHSSSRNCNEDGTWRRKRGVDPKLVERLEHEAAVKAQNAELPPGGEQDGSEVTLHSVMAALDAAETAEDLIRALEPVQALPDDEKEQARNYYRERRAAIVAGQQASEPHQTDDESANDAPMTFETIRDGLYRAASEDEIAAWWEESQHIVISASQRMALEQVRDGRIKSLNAQAA